MSDTGPSDCSTPTFFFLAQTRISHHVQNHTISKFPPSHTQLHSWATHRHGQAERVHVSRWKISCSCVSEMLTGKQMHGKVDFIGYSELLQGTPATHLSRSFTVAADVTAGNFSQRGSGELGRTHWHMLCSPHVICFLSLLLFDFNADKCYMCEFAQQRFCRLNSETLAKRQPRLFFFL